MCEMIPRDTKFDSSVDLLRDPYRYISRRCEAFGADAFEGRLFLRPTVFMRGADYARLFYDPDKFQRRNAFPRPLRRTLIGDGGVQTLDDEAHRGRKKMFLSLMDDGSIRDLTDRFAAEWEGAVSGWAGQREVVLYEALHPMLARAVCGWAGVPLAESEVYKRSRLLRAMFDYAGAKGPKHIRSRLARRQAERWISKLVSDIRGDRLHVPEGSPLQVIARFKGPDGMLDARRAAVEVLNLLRPTVAVSVYIVFIAHALASYPEARPESPEDDMRFVQEVRRFYPFFPSVMALARRDFEWNGYLFPKGRQVVLDLYGNSRDPKNWRDPEWFNPDRFRDARDDTFSLVPQGGGHHATGHRCPGEWITIALMSEGLRLLRRTPYRLPQQDLRIDFARLPALPRSRIVISDAQPLSRL